MALLALGGLAKATLATCALSDYLHIAFIKEVAFEEAVKLSNGRGIVNIGAGPHRTYQAQIIAEAPETLANIDITPNGMPRFMQFDLEGGPLPFVDKRFGCAFLSHVLEHLDNWEFALGEACRVADYVVVVLPDPVYFSGWLCPTHKQHFSKDDIERLAELYPNVEAYY